MQKRRLGRSNLEVQALGLGSLLIQERWIVPIPGAGKFQRMEENTGAAAVELAAED